MSRTRPLLLLPAGLALAGTWLVIASLGDVSQRPVAFVSLYCVAFVVYAAALVV